MTKQDPLIIDADYQDLVPGYIRRRRAELKTIAKKLKENDIAYLKRLSHDWHGTGESYGIPLISEIGEKMTRAVKSGKDGEVMALAEELRTYLDTVDIRYE